MLTSLDGLAPPSTSKISIKPIPVPPPTPLSIAVYAPGGNVMRIAASCVQPGGDVACPGLARHGSKPVAEISLGYFRIRQDNKAILIALLMQITQDSFRSVKDPDIKSFKLYFIFR